MGEIPADGNHIAHPDRLVRGTETDAFHQQIELATPLLHQLEARHRIVEGLIRDADDKCYRIEPYYLNNADHSDMQGRGVWKITTLDIVAVLTEVPDGNSGEPVFLVDASTTPQVKGSYHPATENDLVQITGVVDIFRGQYNDGRFGKELDEPAIHVEELPRRAIRGGFLEFLTKHIHLDD